MNYTVIILRLCYLAFGLSASSNGPSIKLTSISESVKIANQCVCVCEVTVIDQVLCQTLEDVLCSFCAMKQ